MDSNSHLPTTSLFGLLAAFLKTLPPCPTRCQTASASVYLAVTIFARLVSTKKTPPHVASNNKEVESDSVKSLCGETEPTLRFV